MISGAYSLKLFINWVSPSLILLNETQIFQYQLAEAMDMFKGEYCCSLNSEDLYDPELGLVSNRAHGGTMILWKKALDKFVTVLPLCTPSFLPVLLQPPKCLPSIHIAMYLPTSGKEKEFIEEATKLSNFLDETIEKHPGCPIFIRGDSNVNKKNESRVKILNHLLSSHNLKRIEISHNTYHHFIGYGMFDSNIDVILQSKEMGIEEKVITIFCKSEYPEILSHHDPILSIFKLPQINTSDQPTTPEVPTIENQRMRILWSDDNLSHYQGLLGDNLKSLRDRWMNTRSQTSVSLLIELSSAILSSAAAASNKAIHLSEAKTTKSSYVPRHVKRLHSKLRNLNSKLKKYDPNIPNMQEYIYKNYLKVKKT